MVGLSMLQTEYRAGMRIIAGRGRTMGLASADPYAEMRVETVEHVDLDNVARGENARMTLRYGDELRDVLLCRTSIHDDAYAPSRWRTIWTEPLPQDDAAAIALVAGALGAERLRSAILLWIGSVMQDGSAYAHPLIEDARYGEGGYEGHQSIPTSGMAYAPLGIVVQTDVALEGRSLVVAQLKDATEVDGIAIHRIEAPRVIMRDVGLKQAAEAIPIVPRLPGFHASGNFAGWYAICENEERAHALQEDSEALVLCWNEAGRTETKCLAQSGIAFWRNDDPDAYAESSVPGPGLWMWTEVDYRGFTDHEGVYDADMSGKWCPASEEDVERMTGSISAAAEDIVEYTGAEEGVAPETTVSKLIAEAHRVIATSKPARSGIAA